MPALVRISIRSPAQRRRSACGLWIAILATLGACAGVRAPSAASISGGAGDPIPLLVSSEQVVGDNRFVFTFVDGNSLAPVATPEASASVSFFELARSPSVPTTTVPATFVWAIDGVRGIYVLHVTFEHAGRWAADFTLENKEEPPSTHRLDFDVVGTGSVAPVGSRAPAIRSPTAADVGGDLRRISTDTVPDPTFYQTSADQAIAAHRPFVLIFATPAFCTTGNCAPTLGRVRSVAASWPSVTFIHVEPYEMTFTGGRLAPVLGSDGGLQATASAVAYGLRTEPTTFVVDSDGVIRAEFEGPLGVDELNAALRAVQ